MKWIFSESKKAKIINLVALSTLAAFSASDASAHCKKHKCHHHCHSQAAAPVVVYKDEPVKIVSTFVPAWYVGGHVGVSHTHDKAAAGSGNSVTQIGPGWTANLGYQFTHFYQGNIAAEIGYTQYHNSSENTQTTNVAATEHFATYAALVGQYPVIYGLGVMGKIGIAYSYAKKIFNVTGASASANTYSPYYGGGVTYNMTPQAELVLQWARARGNNKTGSTDLTSLGVNYSFW